jgi:acetyl-CoA carboxylase carboxyltransferase component
MESTELLEKLEYLNRKALEGNGPGRIKKQPDSGKLTARERFDSLLDAGTFVKMENNISSNISGPEPVSEPVKAPR